MKKINFILRLGAPKQQPTQHKHQFFFVLLGFFAKVAFAMPFAEWNHPNGLHQRMVERVVDGGGGGDRATAKVSLASKYKIVFVGWYVCSFARLFVAHAKTQMIRLETTNLGCMRLLQWTHRWASCRRKIQIKCALLCTPSARNEMTIKLVRCACGARWNAMNLTLLQFWMGCESVVRLLGVSHWTASKLSWNNEIGSKTQTNCISNFPTLWGFSLIFIWLHFREKSECKARGTTLTWRLLVNCSN